MIDPSADEAAFERFLVASAAGVAEVARAVRTRAAIIAQIEERAASPR